MTITTIIQFGNNPFHEGKPPPSVDDTIPNAVTVLKGVKKPQNFVLGTQVQEKGVVQLTSEWDNVPDNSNLNATPEFTSLMNNMRAVFGEPNSISHIQLESSAFGPDGPATGNVVEHVQSYFPTSRINPEFQKQIEDDFRKFDQIFSKSAKGRGRWVVGWGLDEEEHESIKGEKSRCFYVITAWESMEFFQQSLNTEEFKEAIPILFAWNAPFKMWHVECKVLDMSGPVA